MRIQGTELFVIFLILVPAMSPMNVTGKATTYTAILVKWKHMLPAYAHGIIRGYVVYYEHGNHSEAIAFNDTQVPNREYLEITHLKIFAWYTFQVAAHTTPGLGPKSTPIYVRTNEYREYKLDFFNSSNKLIPLSFKEFINRTVGFFANTAGTRK